MSQQKNEQVPTEGVSEETISGYLRSHSDFFDRHSSLLMALKLPHETGGPAISLLERQAAILRERNGELERQFKDLLAVAKLNNVLVEKIHQLSLQMISETKFAGRLGVLEKSLTHDFKADCAVLVLFKPPREVSDAHRGPFLRVVDRKDPTLGPFASFLKSKTTRCGPMNSEQWATLFESEADTVGSAVMLPLGEKCKQGFLVIGSYDVDHFHPGMRIDLLNRLGELVSVALEQHPDAVQGRAS